MRLLLPGEVVDRYTVVSLLGAGGMGAVYQARDERLRRDVALKVLCDDDWAGESDGASSGAARAVREARSVAALEHPNVVAIYDVGATRLAGEDRDTAYLAMELVRGRLLRTFIGDESVSVNDKLRWLREIAAALAAVHALGLVHRDIKPDNVMIRDDGRAKVLDFGVARRAHLPVAGLSTTAAQIFETVTGDGVRAGTPLYMAPEQLHGDPIDGRCDQFAWGVLAYELLSGASPWGNDTDALRLFAAIFAKIPPPLEAEAIGVPPEVPPVIARALAKSADDRFATMDDLLAALAVHRQVASVTASAGAIAASPATESATHPSMASTPRGAPVPARRSLPRVAYGAIALASAAALAAAIGALGHRRGVEARAQSPLSSAMHRASAKCNASADCARTRGRDFVCRRPNGDAESRCVSLASEYCSVHASDEARASDDTVWLGAMFPLSGEAGRLHGVRNWQATDLARQDFDATLGTESAARALGKVPRFGIVLCDDVPDGAAALHHLLDDARVPAVIGFRTGTELLELSGEIIRHSALAVASLTINPLITAIPEPAGDPRLFFRTTYSGTQSTRAINALLPAVIEPELRAGPSPAVDDAHPMKVALARAKLRNLAPLAEGIFEGLRFNGQTALENGDRYRELVYDSMSATSAKQELAQLVEQILHFLPHVIIDLGYSDFIDAITQVERRWPRALRYRPRWVIGSVLRTTSFALMGSDPSIRHRFYGVTTQSATAPNARFVLHFNETYDEKVSRTFSPNSSYDAFYLLAYAAIALGDEPVTGKSLARAIGKLVPPGKPVDVGVAGIFEAFNALRRGESIDLRGATGALDFDLATGESDFDQDILCVGTDDRGVANDSVESGMVLDAKTGTLRGTMQCP